MLGLLVAACPAGATAQSLAASCLLAAMPLRDSSCPVGAVPPRMGQVKPLSLLWESGVFLLCGCFLPAQLGPQPSRWRLLRLTDGTYPLRGKSLFCLPGWGQNRFFFSGKRKQRFWTPKKKRETSGDDYGLRYNRALDLCCYGIPRVKDSGVSLLFPAAWV